MKIARVKLKSVSTLSWSRYYVEPPMEEQESAEDYDRRTWRERFHYTKEGNVMIPPMAFKRSLEAAAKFRKKKIRGEGQSTYTKHIVAGVLVVDPLVLPETREDLKSETVFVLLTPQNPKGPRGNKAFPIIEQWEGTVDYLILDEKITEPVFTEFVIASGQFVGVGRFRPSVGGYYGRFDVEKVEWLDAA